MKSAFIRRLFVTLALALGLQAAVYIRAPSYTMGGTEGWDYIAVDGAARRIYVSHGVRVNVLDADTGNSAGVIEDTPGVHGIAIAGAFGHGFTSNGKENKVSMLDRKSTRLNSSHLGI